ncbi:HKR1 [Auxenochlorella protothecoides x Auxenochlorella symbiontica]
MDLHQRGKRSPRPYMKPEKRPDIVSPSSPSLQAADIMTAPHVPLTNTFRLGNTILVVLANSISYAACIAYMLWLRPSDCPMATAFYAEVPQAIYIWPMVAFATATVLNLASACLELRPIKRQLCFLAAYITATALVFEALAARGRAPIFWSVSGRPVSLLRYVMWAHATPVIIYTLSMISDFDSLRVWRLVLVDLVMIVTIIPGELVDAWHRWIWNIISFAVFPYICSELWAMYSSAIHASRDHATVRALSALRASTAVFWTLFPFVWTVAQARGVSTAWEELLWTCCDLGGKIIFSTSLLHSNFLTIDDRKMRAMREVIESNRVRVIQELRTLLEQREHFISVMSHELRTPLNGIIGLSSTLLLDLAGEPLRGRGPAVTHDVAAIRSSGVRLLNLVNDILDASALREGKLAVKLERVEVRRVAEDVLALVRQLAAPGVVILNDIPSDLPAAKADTGRLIQVMYNLIGNACKFTDKGCIMLTAGPERENMVSISVSDTGIGIPPSKLDLIFGPFAQADMSYTRRYSGTGLGLHLARQLLAAQGGTIHATSHQNKGSTFTFTLPVYTDADSKAAAVAGVISQGRTLRNPPRIDDMLEEEAGALGLGAQPDGGAAGEDLLQLLLGQAGLDPGARGPGSAPRVGRSGLVAGTPVCVDNFASDFQTDMLDRLSLESRSTYFLATERETQRKAPQQLSPEAAASAFTSAAGPSPGWPGAQGDWAAADAGACGAGGASGDQAMSPFLLPSASTAESGGPPSGSDRGPLVLPLRGGGGAESRPDWQRAWQSVEDMRQRGAIRVLSVDDDPLTQTVVQGMLSRSGFQVSKAADGERALDVLEGGILAGRPPHIVLINLMMPKTSGFDVIRTIRSRWPGLMLPVIILSASCWEKAVVEGLQAGANDYLPKPFGCFELMARIEAQLRTHEFMAEACRQARPSEARSSEGGSGGSGSASANGVCSPDSSSDASYN